MALASVSTSRLLVLMVGAGISGATLYNHVDGITSFFKEVSRAAIHSLTKPRLTSTSSSGQSSSEELQSLAEEISRLSREVSRSLTAVQESSSRQPLVTFIGNGHNRLGSSGFLFSLSVCGSVVVVALVAKKFFGFQIWDLAYVSSRRFNQAFETLKGAVTRVSGALSQVQKDLSIKIKQVEDKVVESNISLEHKLQEEMEDTRRDIYTVGGDVAEVRSIVGNVEQQLEELQNKLRFANRGIYLLCTVVSRLPENSSVDFAPGLNPAREELKEFANSAVVEKMGLGYKPSLPNNLDRGALLGLGSALADLEKSNFCSAESNEANLEISSCPEREKLEKVGDFSKNSSKSMNLLHSENKRNFRLGRYPSPELQ
ncbi:hypothetical protein GpartN1_g766.t1 [Galdieria partita]|uniref:DUF1664 domain-containing protein n=1 Tax=Galdieria partita TaxID=83374 RepID=A0A9C7PR34_9RHOD|nr:hypothetical protein GpartN1_g766.t1 [Galdieria partita]